MLYFVVRNIKMKVMLEQVPSPQPGFCCSFDTTFVVLITNWWVFVLEGRYSHDGAPDKLCLGAGETNVVQLEFSDAF